MGKVLITGASGFLGTKLRTVLSRDFSVVGTCYPALSPRLILLDITDGGAVHDLIMKERPDVVVHTAAIVDCDFCEENRDVAERVNYGGTENIAEACRAAGARMVYMSTSFVFDGEKENYKETDVPHPLNWYGGTKLLGEEAVLQLPDSIVLRADFLYGYNGKELPNGFFGRILSGRKTEVYGDEMRHPLFADDIGRAITVLLGKKATGIFHLAGSDHATKYKLAARLEKIVRDGSCLIHVPERTSVAKRPPKISLDTSLVRSLGVRFFSIAQAVEEIRRQIAEEKNAQ